MKKGLLSLLFVSCLFTCFAQVPSPEQFLGYKIGTRYTPHWRIMEYFRQVAASVPSQVKLGPTVRRMRGAPW